MNALVFNFFLLDSSNAGPSEDRNVEVRYTLRKMDSLRGLISIKPGGNKGKQMLKEHNLVSIFHLTLLKCFVINFSAPQIKRNIDKSAKIVLIVL